MTRKKPVRTRGKLSLSKYFQKFNEGENVAVTIEKSVSFNFPVRLQGRTGKITGKRGKAYTVKIKDQAKEKSFIMEPIHLKKISVEK
ncbi:MAG: 50S ribosomal protein L21e [Nanoarchaeota archaeon]|nr:50S ribosomal protein L21e [Nanoarchaeota archaeon]